MAAFGPQLDSNGVKGQLVPMRDLGDENGCTTVPVPPFINVTWFALVLQSTACSFDTQVRNMQRMGAMAVIVGAMDASTGLLTMEAAGDASDIMIHSVFVINLDYRDLLMRSSEALENFPSFKVHLYYYQTSYWPLVNIIIARIVAPAIIMIFLYSLAFRFRARQRMRRDCATENSVKKLPTRKYATSKPLAVNSGNNVGGEDEEMGGPMNGEEPETCAICLDEYQVGDELRILPCQHEFHSACIDPWLITRKRFCPLCKKDACISEESPLVYSTE